MSTALASTMVNFGNDSYHTPEFLAYVRAHEPILKQYSVQTPIDIGMVHKLEYNLVSLLVELKYPLENLIFFMVANDIDDPIQMTTEMTTLRLPDEVLMSQLKSLYRQVSGRI